MISLEILGGQGYFEAVPIEKTPLELEAINSVKRRYVNLMPLKPKTEAELREVAMAFPRSWMQPVFVSDLVRKKKLTAREETILVEKVRTAEFWDVHPDTIFCFTQFECY
jgi:hypothetical protein